MDTRAAAARKIAELSRDVVARRISPVFASREIARRLRFDVGSPDDDVFLEVRGIDSETEDVVIGELRQLWSREFLDRVDTRLAEYLQGMEAVFEPLVERFSREKP